MRQSKKFIKLGLTVLLVLIVSLTLSACLPEIGRRQFSSLHIESSQHELSVFLNGELMGKTPFQANELEPGSYNLLLQPTDPDLVEHETTILLKPRLQTAVIWNPGIRPEYSSGVILELEELSNRQASELAVTTIPDGGLISINGGDLEYAPLVRRDLPTGSHQVTINLISYETQSHDIIIQPGFRTSAFVKMGREPSPEELARLDAQREARAAGFDQDLEGAEADSPSESATDSAILSEVPLPRVTITATNFFQDGEEVLRVRSQSSAAGAELGFASVGKSYPYLGQTQAGWYQIEFNGAEGWVSNQFSRLEE